MTLSQINRSIRRIIRDLLAMPENSVRPGNQNAPTGEQDEQYATVSITSVDATGIDEARLKNDVLVNMVDETIIGQRLLIASVQFFKGDALTKVARLEALLRSSVAIEKLQEQRLGLVRISAVRNLTDLVDTFWEERGQVDIEFYLIAQEDVVLPSFGTFPYSADFDPPIIISEVIEP